MGPQGAPSVTLNQNGESGMYALVLALAAATAASPPKPVSVAADAEAYLAAGAAVCRPDVRGNEERMMRAFLNGAYWPATRTRLRCRIA